MMVVIAMATAVVSAASFCFEVKIGGQTTDGSNDSSGTRGDALIDIAQQ